MRRSRIDLIGKGRPVLGMRSSVDPSQLPEGLWQVVENLRIGKGYCTPRYDPKKQNGADLHAAGGITAMAGHWSGYLNGVHKTYMVLKGSPNQLYEVNLSAMTATLIGGLTTGSLVEFAPFRDPSQMSIRGARDFILLTDGTNQYVIDPTTGTLMTAGASIPSGATDHSYRPSPSAYFNVQDPANTTYAASGASLVSADTGAAGVNEWQVTLPAAAAVNDTTTCTFGAGSCVYVPDATTSASIGTASVDQIWLLCSDTIGDPVWNYVNLQVNIGGTYYTIYSATGAAKQEPVYVDLGSEAAGYYLAGFTIDKGATWPGGAFTALRLQLAKTVPAAHSFKISGILAGGNIPGATEYRMSYVGANGLEATVKSLKSVPPDMFVEFGCSKSIAARVPNSTSFRYWYKNSYYDHVSSARHAFYYRREPDQNRFYMSHYVALGSATSYQRWTFDLTSSDSVDYTRAAPSFTNLSYIPTGSTACWANNRLYIGGSASTTTDESSRLYISDEGYGARFTAVAYDGDGDGIPDAESGTMNRFSGEKVVRAVPFTSAVGTTGSLATVILWTNKGTRRIEGTDSLSLTRPVIINQHGMQDAAKFSVAQSRMSVYYVDVDKIVRRIDAGVETTPISLWKVDDQIPSSDMFGLAWQDRYYLFYKSGSDSYAIVYDELLGEWVRDKYTSISDIGANGLWFAFLSNDFPAKAYAFTYQGKQIYRLEDSTSTTDPTITLKSAELEIDGWERHAWGTVGLVADKDTYTWTTSRTDPQNSGNTTTAAGELDLNTDTPERAWIEDRTASSGMCAITAPSCVLTVSGQYSPGKYIKRLLMYIEPRSGGGAKPSA